VKSEPWSGGRDATMLNWRNTVSQDYDYTLGEKGILHKGSHENIDTWIARKNKINFFIEYSWSQKKWCLLIWQTHYLDSLFKERRVTFNDKDWFDVVEEAKVHAEQWFSDYTRNPSLIHDRLNQVMEELRKQYEISTIEQAKSEVFPTGKYSGKNVGECWENNRDYCMFYIANVQKTLSNCKALDSIVLLLQKELEDQISLNPQKSESDFQDEVSIAMECEIGKHYTYNYIGDWIILIGAIESE